MVHNGAFISVETYCKDRENVSEKERLRYVLEVDNCCPVCGKVLTTNAADKKRLYEIAHIFPNSPTEAEKNILADVEVLGENSECFENKIALCRDCHKEYDENKTVIKYDKMLKLKKRLLQNFSAKTDLSHNSIEKELISVICDISSLAIGDKQSVVESLSYQAMKVKDKITTDKILCTQVESLVSNYFLYIETLFKSLDDMSFETIASSFRHSYCQALKSNLTQEEIFEKLTDWVKNKTKCSRTVAQMVVAFFIQDCEVYGKISR